MVDTTFRSKILLEKLSLTSHVTTSKYGTDWNPAFHIHQKQSNEKCLNIFEFVGKNNIYFMAQTKRGYMPLWRK